MCCVVEATHVLLSELKLQHQVIGRDILEDQFVAGERFHSEPSRLASQKGITSRTPDHIPFSSFVLPCDVLSVCLVRAWVLGSKIPLGPWRVDSSQHGKCDTKWSFVSFLHPPLHGVHLDSQVAGKKRPLHPKVDLLGFKVAHNYEPLALQACLIHLNYDVDCVVIPNSGIRREPWVKGHPCQSFGDLIQ